MYLCIYFTIFFQIFLDTGIHSNLVTFIALLLAYNCFTIQDIFVYIVRPIFKVYLMYPQEASKTTQTHLLVEYCILLYMYM